jgi:hypothetical protein
LIGGINSINISVSKLVIATSVTAIILAPPTNGCKGGKMMMEQGLSSAR